MTVSAPPLRPVRASARRRGRVASLFFRLCPSMFFIKKRRVAPSSLHGPTFYPPLRSDLPPELETGARVAGAGRWLPAHQSSSLGLAGVSPGFIPNFSSCRFAAVASPVDGPQPHPWMGHNGQSDVPVTFEVWLTSDTSHHVQSLHIEVGLACALGRVVV